MSRKKQYGMTKREINAVRSAFEIVAKECEDSKTCGDCFFVDNHGSCPRCVLCTYTPHELINVIEDKVMVLENQTNK